MLSVDTDPRAEEVLIARLREMGATRRLARVFELRETALSLARARLHETSRDLPRREVELRLAALWLDPELLYRAYGWRAAPDELSP